MSDYGSGVCTTELSNAAELFENPDDSVTVTVSLDHGAVLNGTGVVDNGNGTFTITAHQASDLSGLTITPVESFEGTVAIGVSAVAHDRSEDHTSGLPTHRVHVCPLLL